MNRLPFNFALGVACIRRLLIVVMTAAVLIEVPFASAQELTEEQPPRRRDDRDNRRNDDRQRAGDDDPTRGELKQRFEARLAELNRMKDRGLIGEVFDGTVAALDDRLLSRDQKKTVDDENADRQTLYRLIAERVEERERQVPPRVVAERNAKRNFEKADARHYLKIEEHRWIQKRDEARARQIERLKDDGVVGETFEGYLEAVRGSQDEQVRQVIERENRDRRAMYDQIAGSIEKANAEQVARQLAREAYEHLPPGHYYKSRQGAWERKPSRR